MYYFRNENITGKYFIIYIILKDFFKNYLHVNMWYNNNQGYAFCVLSTKSASFW